MTDSETPKSDRRQSTPESCKPCEQTVPDPTPSPMSTMMDSDLRPYDYHGELTPQHRPTSLFEQPNPPERPQNRGDRAPTEAHGPSREGHLVLATRVQGVGADPAAVSEWLIASEHYSLEEVR